MRDLTPLSSPRDLTPLSSPVGTLFYEYPAREDTPRRSRRVPWLQMRGDWLAAAGFDIRAPVRVRVMRGCLVLTVEES